MAVCTEWGSSRQKGSGHSRTPMEGANRLSSADPQSYRSKDFLLACITPLPSQFCKHPLTLNRSVTCGHASHSPTVLQIMISSSGHAEGGGDWARWLLTHLEREETPWHRMDANTCISFHPFLCEDRELLMSFKEEIENEKMPSSPVGFAPK